MGKAKHERKKEMADLNEWFKDFSKSCPWRTIAKNDHGQQKIICSPTLKPKMSMICNVINCAPLYLANRLLQMTLGWYEPWYDSKNIR